MSEYVYLPESDGEWSVMSRSEYDTTGGEGVYGPAEPATLVFNLDGARGHYLAADFIQQAWHVLGSSVRMSEDEARKASSAQADAVTYREHEGGAVCGASGDTDRGMCSRCEFIHDAADAVSRILTDHGFVVEWNDGVYVYKVDGDI